MADQTEDLEMVAGLTRLRRQAADFLDECLNAFDWGRYDIVGFTSTFQQNTPSLSLARLVKSPVDIQAQNRHMIQGTFHGGDRTIAQSGALRPAPGWGAHRMPIAGLYQTGGTTHPGGSITGAPGRNAAAVLLSDLGSDLEEVLAGARRPRAGSHR